MKGTHIRQWAAGLVTAAVLSATLVPGTTSAANTRLLYVGDPAGVNVAFPYFIHPTPVSPGNVTYFDVLIKNLGKQTLTSAMVGMGTLIADNNGAPGPGLPSGWTILKVTNLPGISPTCTFAGPAGASIGLSCDFGNLARGASGTIRVYLTAGSSLSSNDLLVVSGKVAEAVGGNVGSNSNTFYATGDPAIKFFYSDAGQLAGLFNGPGKHEPTHSTTDPSAPKTYIDLGSVSGDTLVLLDETSTHSCASGVTCLGTAAAGEDKPAYASVNGGAAVSPYFTWVMQFPVDSNFKLTNKDGIIHYYTDGTTATLFNVTKTSCSKPVLPCADFSLVTDLGGQTYVQVILHTSKNGFIKAF